MEAELVGKAGLTDLDQEGSISSCLEVKVRISRERGQRDRKRGQRDRNPARISQSLETEEI